MFGRAIAEWSERFARIYIAYLMSFEYIYLHTVVRRAQYCGQRWNWYVGRHVASQSHKRLNYNKIQEKKTGTSI